MSDLEAGTFAASRFQRGRDDRQRDRCAAQPCRALTEPSPATRAGAPPPRSRHGPGTCCRTAPRGLVVPRGQPAPLCPAGRAAQVSAAPPPPPRPLPPAAAAGSGPRRGAGAVGGGAAAGAARCRRRGARPRPRCARLCLPALLPPAGSAVAQLPRTGRDGTGPSAAPGSGAGRAGLGAGGGEARLDGRGRGRGRPELAAGGGGGPGRRGAAGARRMAAAGSITTLPALPDDGGSGAFPPGHFKDPKRLYCKNGGFFLRINPDGRVDGVREKSDPHIKLQLQAEERGVVSIKGVSANRFLAMKEDGRLLALKCATEECFFFERLESNNYNTYRSRKYSDWYVALKRTGQYKPGPKTGPGQKAILFLPMSAKS
ncbi:LOW QUALITY PROTEIN: fibroblast growth factor 2 [Mycteria americana]|uniref:LOW QUALITY PROTEIN: fibroblast growth factor 2 n=1 Tax=Mycteria americana TaxID=33587 RepID=UPI003F58BE6F